MILSLKQLASQDDPIRKSLILPDGMKISNKTAAFGTILSFMNPDLT
jgi:hypothetical protein